MKDEFEAGDRKLLNFGHTLGHAVENIYELPHGHAVAIGMKAACLISEEMLDFKETARVTDLLEKYGLADRSSQSISEKSWRSCGWIKRKPGIS